MSSFWARLAAAEQKVEMLLREIRDLRAYVRSLQEQLRQYQGDT